MSTRNPAISKGIDWSLVWIWFILCAIGITSIFAASYHDGENVIQGFISLKTDYSRCITFNEGAYEGIMRCLKEIGDGAPQYAFLDAPLRKRLVAA